MGKLLRFLKNHWIFAVMAPLFMLLEVVMDLYQPALMADIIDKGVTNGDLHYIVLTGQKMLLFAVIGMFGGVGCIFTSSAAAAGFGTDLRQGIFNKIQDFSFAEIDKLKTSSLITRVTNDVTQLQNIVLLGLRIMVRAPLLCVGSIIMACAISLRLSLIFVVMLPLMSVIIIYVIKTAFPLFAVVQKKIDRVNTVMRENLLGVRVVKAFVGQPKESSRFGLANEELMDISVKAQIATVLIWPALVIILNFSVIAVLWFGGLMSVSGTLATGQIMAFVNYLLQIMFSLMMTVMLFVGFSRGKASADRICEVLETDISVKEADQPKEPARFDVEFKNVYFKYHTSGSWVLEDVSFHAGEGETVGIIGATGSGKSSLIGLIPRLYDTTGGDITIGGVNVKELRLSSLRENIGVVLQESILFSGTIGDNLRFGSQDADEETVRRAVQIAQAYEFIAEMPQEYDSEVEQRGKNLSGGQKQRVSIARTLTLDPRILILDDSSSALDMATEARLQNALRDHLGHCTTFIIAQRISGVMYADKIIVLDEGRISGVGTHQELLRSNEIYRSIVISQLGEEAAEHA